MRVATKIELSKDERDELTKLVRSKQTSVRLSQRAHIVLLAATGLQNQEIAAQLKVVPRTGLALARAVRPVTLGRH